MQLFIGVLIGLIVLVILVVVHELAHAWVAKRNGVTVEEFGIGLPPKAWGKKLKNGVLFTLNWLPIGGFVKMQGEHDAARKKGDYGAAGFWGKTKILFAGVTANWLLAAFILAILSIFGLPKVLPNQFMMAGDSVLVNQPVEITGLTAGKPAEAAGLRVGDTVIQFAGQKPSTSEELSKLIGDNKGKTTQMTYSRGGQESTIDIALSDNTEGGILGINMGQRSTIKSTWSAPIVGVVTTAQFTWETLSGLGGLVANLFNGIVSQFSSDSAVRDQAAADLKTAGDSVAGPIGILGTIFPAASSAGPMQLLFLTAIISLTLAVMNILPIPALDGGRWFTMMLFRLTKKSLTFEREEKIQTIGFYILMGLIVLVTITDVAKIF
ncbi:MAG: M50 family metallopeptidase [Candidatus Saccharibacteria bacterium]